MAKKETNSRSIEETLWQACDKVANENKIEKKEYKVEHLGAGVAPATRSFSFAMPFGKYKDCFTTHFRPPEEWNIGGNLPHRTSRKPHTIYQLQIK